MLSLRDVAIVVSRRRAFVVSTFLAGSLGGALYWHHAPVTYVAAARVLLIDPAPGRDSFASPQSVRALATNPAVVDMALGRLSPAPTRSALETLRATVSPRSHVVTIFARSPSAEFAIAVVNVDARETAGYYRRLLTADADADVKRLDRALERRRAEFISLNARAVREAGDPSFAVRAEDRPALRAGIADLKSQRAATAAALGRLAAAAVVDGPRERERRYDRTLRRLSLFAASVAGAQPSLPTDFAAATGLRVEVGSGLPRHRFAQRPARDALSALRAAMYSGRPAEAANASGDDGAARRLSILAAYSASREARLLRSYPELRSAIPRSLDEDAAEGPVTGATANARIDLRADLAALDARLSGAAALLRRPPPRALVDRDLERRRAQAQAAYLMLFAQRAAAVANRTEALSSRSVVVVDSAIAAEAIRSLPSPAVTWAGVGLLLLVSLGSASAAEQVALRRRLWPASRRRRYVAVPSRAFPERS